jgi:hypothetical protein
MVILYVYLSICQNESANTNLCKQRKKLCTLSSVYLCICYLTNKITA